MFNFFEQRSQTVEGRASAISMQYHAMLRNLRAISLPSLRNNATQYPPFPPPPAQYVFSPTVRTLYLKLFTIVTTYKGIDLHIYRQPSLVVEYVFVFLRDFSRLQANSGASRKSTS